MHPLLLNTFCFRMVQVVNNKISLLIPPGIGNGYFVQSNESIYHYKLAYEGFYNDSNQQFSYRWNDKNLGVNWPVKKPILSERDAL